MIEFGVKIAADKLQGNYDSPKPVENADQLFPGTVHVHSCTIMNHFNFLLSNFPYLVILLHIRNHDNNDAVFI